MSSCRWCAVSNATDYPDEVNGHHLCRRQLPRHDHTRVVYKCTNCKSVAEHPTDFRTFGCPGGEYRGAPLVDTADVREGRGEDE